MDAFVKEYLETHRDEALRDLERLCNQPSVSAQNLGVHECTQVVASLLQEVGASPRLLSSPSGGPPAVFGQIEGESPRTVLLYDHYDVQPPEPLELWSSPPFKLTVRDGKAYARGVSDDKGCFIARLAAVKAFLKVKGKLPCTVKFFLEGEEEVGSPHLEPLVLKHQDLLTAEGCIWEGGGVDWKGRPTINLGLKGLVYLELVARGPNRDVHSSYGGVVPNPAWRLAWALSSLKSPSGRIRIRGFYDRVRKPTRAERRATRHLPDDDAQLRDSLGLAEFLGGVTGYAFRRTLLLQPSSTICGFLTGYTGEGTKTVLPAEARAKIDFRLVPDQEPQEVINQLKRHLKEHGFGDIEVVDPGGHVAPARTPLESPWARLVEEAAQEAYGREAVLSPTMAGSGPMHLFTNLLKLPVAAAAGVGYPDNRIHAPNENIHVNEVLNGALHMAALLERLGR